MNKNLPLAGTFQLGARIVGGKFPPPEPLAMTAENENLPFERHLKRVFLVFRITAENSRGSEGRDEYTVESMAAALEMPKPIARQAIERLRELGCIEIASTSPKSTVWRFALGSEMPPECPPSGSSKASAPRAARKSGGR